MHIRMIAPMQMQIKENIRIKRMSDTIPKAEFVEDKEGIAYTVIIMVLLFVANLFLI